MKKITMIKDGGIKFVDQEAVKELLLEQGWKIEGLDGVVEDDREELMAKAKKLGLKPHHATGAKKLAEMIEEHRKNFNRELAEAIVEGI